MWAYFKVSHRDKELTMSDQGLWNASYGEVGATLKALQDQGVTLQDLKRVRSDPRFASRIARLIRYGWHEDWNHPPYEETDSQQMIRRQIPEQFFGVNEVQRLGLRYSEEELRQLAVLPSDILADWRETDVVFPGFAISVKELARLLQDKKILKQFEHTRSCYSRKGEVRWHRISTEAFDGKGGRSPIRHFPQNYTQPFLADVTLMVCLQAIVKSPLRLSVALVCKDEPDVVEERGRRGGFDPLEVNGRMGLVGWKPPYDVHDIVSCNYGSHQSDDCWGYAASWKGNS